MISRLIALLAALMTSVGVCSDADAQSFGNGGALGSPAVGGGAFGSSSPSASCGALPGSPLYVFDSDNVDGANNTTLTNGAYVSTWVNLGSVGASGNATQVPGPRQPTFESGVLNGHAAVSFDGVSDWLEIGASATNMTSFLANKRGHIVIVYRHDANKVTGYGQLFSNSNSSGTPGFQWGINANGTAFVYVVGASSTYKGIDPSTSPPLTTWKWHQLKSDATTLSYQQYGNSAQTVSIASGFTTSASALPGNVSIGSRTGSIGEAVDGAIAFVAYYSDQLSAGNQTALETWMSCRYGF